MNNNILFALDAQAQEVIVSESPKGSNKVNCIERIRKNENEALYHATLTLTLIAQAPNLDTALLKQWIKYVKCCMQNTMKEQVR